MSVNVIRRSMSCGLQLMVASVNSTNLNLKSSAVCGWFVVRVPTSAQAEERRRTLLPFSTAVHELSAHCCLLANVQGVQPGKRTLKGHWHVFWGYAHRIANVVFNVWLLWETFSSNLRRLYDNRWCVLELWWLYWNLASATCSRLLNTVRLTDRGTGDDHRLYVITGATQSVSKTLRTSQLTWAVSSPVGCYQRCTTWKSVNT